MFRRVLGIALDQERWEGSGGWGSDDGGEHCYSVWCEAFQDDVENLDLIG